MSNDLLCYSIMNQTQRAQPPVAPMPLPMVHKIPRMSSVVLPPVSNLAVFDSPSKLTEQNLQQNLLNLSRAASFASVNAAASPARAGGAAGTSAPPLRRASDRSDSLASSASSAYSNEPSSVPTSSAPTSPALPPSPKMAIMDAAGHTKRRQRLGPSCDSCRSRKVKCDADILVLAKCPQEMNFAHMKVSSTQINNLFNNNTPIKLDDDSFIIVANEKVIKFTPCKSCSSKGLPCSFSKGFTKEDIIVNSKKSDSAAPLKRRPSVSKVTKPRIESASPVAATLAVSVARGAGVLASAGSSSRKSSCSSCRRRKVKCVYNASANKCDGCLKKSTSCSYDM
ncbi:hypothetical protein JA9_003192 [Meyerozyma sp. JA9]|nr:hypothetical protein JA9_003192 [Meyerozyma sp. JA9]